MIIGITGSFGSGKTTVARIFKKFTNCSIIDADKITRDLEKPNKILWKNILMEFGRGILKNKKIDRKKLADIVFSDKNKLKKLNKITRPEIIKEIKNKIRSSNKEFIILDVPLLIEAGMLKMVDKLIVVKTDRKVLMDRLAKKYSKGEILKRITSQLSLRKKIKFADYVIDDSKSLKDTEKQVNDICKKMEGGMIKELKKSLK